MVQRHGDFSGIRTRLQLGIALMTEELAALDRLDKGDKAKTGRKDPDAAFETIACLRWLIEVDGMSAATARSIVAEMMDTTPGAIKARVARAKGLGENIASLAFNVHMQRGMPPALLRGRTPTGHCTACKRVRCKCSHSPRPPFLETPEGATVTALLSLWSR
ncbi:hypothetical protein AKL17_1803 [Frigidibacter mobilis]|uniref:Uncharacterized protein n=2 Tax=Frigidibacter mobilis TaxID=1335048 RepID=A0A159Z483_9RHOB|nr:hypothetical protein AKL17_1803 [Frigidibacter mobilis]